MSEVNLRAMGVEDAGAMLITHKGLSGPAVLRLSAFAALDMKSGPVFLLVSRSGDDVSVARLSKGEWDFLAAIGGGENLEQALAGKDFDASAALSQHLAAGNLIAG